MSDDHLSRMGDTNWHVEPRSHGSMRQGKSDLLRFDGIRFPAQEQARRAGIQKTNQHGITVKFVADSVQAHHRQQERKQGKRQNFSDAEPQAGV